MANKERNTAIMAAIDVLFDILIAILIGIVLDVGLFKTYIVFQLIKAGYLGIRILINYLSWLYLIKNDRVDMMLKSMTESDFPNPLKYIQLSPYFKTRYPSIIFSRIMSDKDVNVDARLVSSVLFGAINNLEYMPYEKYKFNIQSYEALNKFALDKYGSNLPSTVF